MKEDKKASLHILLLITVLNYSAQIPYYLHNYYLPHHLIPGLRAVGLLGFTLAWFITGYLMYTKKLKYGFGILLSYLIVEALFYGMTILSGAFVSQLRYHSDLIRVVFIIGYVSGITSGYYAFLLIYRRKLSPSLRHGSIDFQ